MSLYLEPEREYKLHVQLGSAENRSKPTNKDLLTNSVLLNCNLMTDNHLGKHPYS